MSDTLFSTEYKSAAGLSPDGMYRYWLRRTWNEDKPVVCFIMLNPSTADAHVDDATIRRCVGFAKSWGYGALSVVNLFAYRATDPKELSKAADPIGPENDVCIEATTLNRRVVCAWGCGGELKGRAKEVLESLRRREIDVRCLGTTKDGHPRHPLYVKGNITAGPLY